ncbi:MAG: ethanolamine utilization protein EutJ [Chloroflexi bacterium]|nr:ethanolamine utilization protein EutJ [Chloroflexota bacterium]MBI3341265.1 ethanolamine utilization protein EutJ [Chloroflexota bacterium]
MAGANGWHPDPDLVSASGIYRGKIHVGVDLGTAYTVLVVLNENFTPIAGEYQFAQVTRDGLVVDFVGAVDLLKKMKTRVEEKLGFKLTSAATGFPPGVPQAEVRATANVLYGAGLDCTGLIDEPTAANNILRVKDGVIVDVGGGTTGVAIFENGRVVYTADEATGGTHFSLVIAGSTGSTFEQAEALKKNPEEQTRLFPVIRPVMEKVASIVNRHIEGFRVDKLYLVGGTCAYPGMDKVIEEMTGIETILPGNPLFITPLGIAMHNN